MQYIQTSVFVLAAYLDLYPSSRVSLSTPQGSSSDSHKMKWRGGCVEGLERTGSRNWKGLKGRADAGSGKCWNTDRTPQAHKGAEPGMGPSQACFGDKERPVMPWPVQAWHGDVNRAGSQPGLEIPGALVCMVLRWQISARFYYSSCSACCWACCFCYLGTCWKSITWIQLPQEKRNKEGHTQRERKKETMRENWDIPPFDRERKRERETRKARRQKGKLHGQAESVADQQGAENQWMNDLGQRQHAKLLSKLGIFHFINCANDSIFSYISNLTFCFILLCFLFLFLFITHLLFSFCIICQYPSEIIIEEEVDWFCCCYPDGELSPCSYSHIGREIFANICRTLQ